MRFIKYALVFMLLAGSIGLLTGCPPKDAGGGKPTLSDPGNLPEEHVAPFDREHLPSIEGNKEHEAHFAAGSKCGDCHLSTEPLPVNTAHEVCKECHPDRTVTKPVWENHCLSCHHFTVSAQANQDNPDAMMRDLCSKCHTDKDAEGGHLNAFIADEHDEMVQCDHCHRPHDSDAPAAASLCVTCHEDLTNARHPQGSTSTCGTCHKPHSPRPVGSQVCVTCHGQAEDVLVHKIPDHPNDCLVCHQPHFTRLEIKGVCTDCHDNMPNFDSGGPAAHLDCQNCHNLETFAFKGGQACAGCHKTQGAVLSNADAPSTHKNCTGCHPAHTWGAAAGGCQRCHQDVSGVMAHDFEFHPKTCTKCHDTHLAQSPPASTDCQACHQGTGVLPSFGSNPPELHLQCANCHDMAQAGQNSFAFVGIESSCQICHGDTLEGAPGGHTDCLNCHQPHGFVPAPAAESCAICHSDVADAAGNEMHQECRNCHSGAHQFKFAGFADSCALCHSDVSGDAPSEMHQQCGNCHNLDHEFGFVGNESSCEVCHADVYGAAINDMHRECSNCHEAEHSFKFTGAESSCQICHSGMGYEHNAAGHCDCVNCHASHSFQGGWDACTVCHTDRENHFAGFECSKCHKFGPGGVFTEDMQLAVNQENAR